MPSAATPNLTKFLASLCLQVFALGCLLLMGLVGRGQTPPEPKGQTQDQSDVLRVYTDLVQTDVMVFDKQGRFVNGLKSEDFDLRIDGKLRPVEFFEKVTAGSINEEAQIAAARGSSRPRAVDPVAHLTPLDRGRAIFFYVDDLHLDLAALQTMRKLIANFIDNEMGQNDEVAIASASGQIGFLQQLSDNKAVLRAALARIRFRPYSVRDSEHPSMSEYQGLLITNYDHSLTEYFIDETIKLNPGISRNSAESMVQMRARSLAQQAGQITVNTLSGLESLIRAANKLPGRKLLFFISGGFFLDDRNSDSYSRLQRITSAAARTGIVIYSMDARGLVASLQDASSDAPADPTGRLARADSGELLASQDSLNALAADTGGKAIFNNNSLEPRLGRALKETSTYYLLAWRPEGEARQASKFHRIQVKVIGKPDLAVQVRRGFFDREPELPIAKASKTSNPTKAHPDRREQNAKQPPMSPLNSPEVELRKVMLGPYPTRDIPISLNLSFVNTPTRGPLLSTAMQMPNDFFSFEPVEGKQTAVVTVAGTLFDDRGNAGAVFNDRITIKAPSVAAAKEGPDLFYGYPVYVGPGLYQVRVGVRDEKTGRSGTAHGWIEVPNMSEGQLTLSSLLLGLRMPAAIGNASANTPSLPHPVELSVAHHFAANGYLRFLVFIYNAALAPTDAKPDVAIQVQLVRDEQPVVTTALKKVSVEDIADFARLPYAAEVSLNGLPPGRYLLQVTTVDRVAKRSASQQTRFEIQ